MKTRHKLMGGREKIFEANFTNRIKNPPFGATFTYYLKDALKTKKETRQEAEKKAPVTAMPSRAELSAEEEEEAPAIICTVCDSTGHVGRRLPGPVTAGIQRVPWRLPW